MARTKSKDLTEAELRIMQVVWKKAPVTVADVEDALSKHGLAYNTVLTMMRILEDKGYLRHSKPEAGRAFVYHPVVGRAEASQTAVRHLLGRFFGGSPGELVLNVLEQEKLSNADLAKIRKRIEEAKA